MKTEEEITKYLKQVIEEINDHVSYLKRTNFAKSKPANATKSSSSSASSSSTSSASSEGASDYSNNSSNSSPEPKKYPPFTCDYCYGYYLPSDTPRTYWYSPSFSSKKFCKKSCIDSFLKNKLSEKEREEAMQKIREDSERSSEAHREWMRKSEEERRRSREEHMRSLDETSRRNSDRFRESLDKMKKENDEYWNQRGARNLQDSKKWALKNIAEYLRIYELPEEIFTQIGHGNWKEKIGNCASWDEIHRQYNIYIDLLKNEGKKKQTSILEEYWKEDCIRKVESCLKVNGISDEFLNKKLRTSDWRQLIRELSNQNQAESKQQTFISKIEEAKVKGEIAQEKALTNNDSIQTRSGRNQDNSAATLGGLLLLGGIVLLIIYLVRKSRRG